MAATPIAPLLGGWLLAHESHYVAMYIFVALLFVAATIVTLSRAVREVPMASEWGHLRPDDADPDLDQGPDDPGAGPAAGTTTPAATA